MEELTPGASFHPQLHQVFLEYKRTHDCWVAETQPLTKGGGSQSQKDLNPPIKGTVEFKNKGM